MSGGPRAGRQASGGAGLTKGTLGIPLVPLRDSCRSRPKDGNTTLENDIPGPKQGRASGLPRQLRVLSLGTHVATSEAQQEVSELGLRKERIRIY